MNHSEGRQCSLVIVLNRRKIIYEVSLKWNKSDLLIFEVEVFIVKSFKGLKFLIKLTHVETGNKIKYCNFTFFYENFERFKLILQINPFLFRILITLDL